MHARRTVGLVSVGFLGVVAFGCGQKKIAECNALVQVINASVTGLEKAPKTDVDPSGVSDLKAMADAMDKIAASASSVQLTLRDVKKLRDDYQKMAKDIAKAERELAQAAEDRDPGRRSTAETALDAAVKQEDPLVEQINKYCQAE
jgi:hypothetical protein